MTPTDDADRIGIAGPPDHPVFSAVAAALVVRGHEVTVFDPERPIPRRDLDDLSLYVAKRTRPASLRALRYAERSGVPTWNSATGSMFCAARFTQLCALCGAGFPVPVAGTSKPDGEYVAKGLYHWNARPELNGDGDVYEELLPAGPVDYKYYVVDDGAAYRTSVLRATSKLWGEKRILGESSPVPELVSRIERLLGRLDMRALGVDVVRADGEWYAVDLNPCPSFRTTGLEDALVDSIESCLASG